MALYRAASSPKRMLVVMGGDHLNIPEDNIEAYAKELMVFASSIN